MPEFLQPVAEILVTPPLALVHVKAPLTQLQGEGTLPGLEHATAFAQYGAQFTATTIPPYLGHTTSLRPFFKLPLLQLWFLFQSGGSGALMAGKWEMHEPVELVRFFSLELSAIEFSVLPGVVVDFGYLTFL